jgi:hypothetical protein
VDTHAAATRVVAGPSSPRGLASSSREPIGGRWPAWARLAILIGGSAALWAGLGWIALRVLELG